MNPVYSPGPQALRGNARVDWGLLAAFVTAFPAAADEPGWGTVKGQVVWGGDKLLNPRVINVQQDKQHCEEKGPVLDQEWVVDPKSKGVRWVFVWLAPEPGGSKLAIHPDLAQPKEKEVVIDQPRCQFEPRAVCLRQGQDLRVKNSSPVGHNVKSDGHPVTNPGSNVVVPAGQAHVIMGLRADRLPVKLACNIHPWMSGWVRIFDHPYFAVTDAEGRFEIKQAPAGSCRLVVWHEGVGFRGGSQGRNGVAITVKAGAAIDMGKLDIKP